MTSSHLTRARMATNSSTTFPNVALISPPRVGPTRRDISSVANPNNLASGIIAKKLTTKVATPLTLAKWRAKDIGTQTSKTFNQLHLTVYAMSVRDTERQDLPIAMKLCQFVGAALIERGDEIARKERTLAHFLFWFK